MNAPTAVITGAAGGLGHATARQLLAAGFDVVAVTRDAATADAARSRLAPVSGERTVRTHHADLTDRDAVRALAHRLRESLGHVDVLINNAGAAFPRYEQTADGAERTFAVNHLAPFHLTHLLLADGLLAPAARIITISSDLVSRGRLDTDEPDITGVTWHDRFNQLTVYGSAKLASLLATTTLAARLPAGMHAYSANPGVIRTAFNAKSGGLLKLVSSVTGLFAKTPEKAARTPVRLATAATAPQPNGGLFAKGRLATAPVVDPALAARVYQRTADALGLTALPPTGASPPSIEVHAFTLRHDTDTMG